MKKLLSLFLVCLLTVLTFAGCGADETSSTADVKETSVTTSNVSSETVTTTSTPTSSTSSKKPSSSSKVERPSSEVETYSEEEIVYSAKEKIYYGMDPDLYKLSLKNKGNSARIAALMKKANKGGSYKIAVLGGSISRGAGASGSSLSYGNLICEWWCANFPDATFEFVNAGFGSTNPEMACYRINEDLLKHNPDFVVVDFTVNTYLDHDVYNTYSTILYKILSQKNAPAVMSIDFTNCDKNAFDRATYKKTKDVPVKAITDAATAYDIPSMSYHNYVWEKIKKRKLTWLDIGSDYIHPNDNGHMVAANIIISHLKEVKNNLSKYSGTITTPKKPEISKYLNLGYIINTVKGASFNGGFVKNSNDHTDRHGWSYNFTSSASSLTVPVSAGKSVNVFMSFNDGTSGQITVTDSNQNTKTISSSDAKTPTLVELGGMSGKITFTPQLENGGFTIYGIGIEK